MRKHKNKIIWGIIILIVSFIVYRSIRKRVLENRIKKAIDSQEGKYGTSQDLKNDKALDTDYHNNALTYISNADANRLAKQIHDAKGTFNDDEDDVYNAFKSCKNKGDVSKVSASFKDKYNKDIYTYLELFLNDTEMDEVYSIIKSKN